MDNPCTLPAQLVIEGDIGSHLLNAAALRDGRLARARSRAQQSMARPIPNPHRIEDTVALGVAALLEHCRKRLRANPLEMAQCRDGSTLVRVFGAFEYVFDYPRCRISARAVNHGPGPCAGHEGVPQLLDSQLGCENIELMSPLCRSYWLRYVAHGPDGICGAGAAMHAYQQALWPDCPHVVQVLGAVCQASYRQLRCDPQFQRLRNVLSYRLIELAGTHEVDWALRARTCRGRRGLDARDVSLVWKHRQLYARMDRENPRLLPVLTAWLRDKRLPAAHGIEDAVPAMRQGLLDAGLPSRAWRYLAEHGPRALAYRQDGALTWDVVLSVLRDLHKARWPAPPPRGFLGFLNDTAGVPHSYTEPGAGVPGWFWNWACHAARDCAHDPQRYRRLRDQLVQWAWLVRKCAPRPDNNQQRRRLPWLQSWAERQERSIALSDRDAWGEWLRDMPWDRIERVQVVALLSPRALREEGIAMHNCADRYLPGCLKGERLLLSLRDPASGKRVALLGLRRESGDGGWARAELSAPCNRAAPAWVEPLAGAALAMVRKADDARRVAQGRLRACMQESGNTTQEPGNGQGLG